MKLTPWFPGTVKPVRVGVYERLYNTQTFYCLWDGEYWHVWATTQVAAEKVFGFSAYQNFPWRGVMK